MTSRSIVWKIALGVLAAHFLLHSSVHAQPLLVKRMLAGPWTLHKLSSSINTSDKTYGPFLNDDGLTLFFVARKPTGLPDHNFDQVFVTSRDDANDTTWTAPEYFTILNSGEANGPVVRDSAGEFFLASSRPSVTGSDMNLWFGAIRGKKLQLGPIPPPVNSKWWETQPSISYDGKTMIFSSNRPLPGSKENPKIAHLYIAHRLNDTMWTEPRDMGEKLNGGSNAGWPFLSEDGKVLLFCSNMKHSWQNLLYVTYRTGEADTAWADPVELPAPINSELNELCPFLSPSGDMLFFASGRDRMGRGFDLFEARLPGAIWKR